MKILLKIFILILSIQSLVKADDIGDFEIEGISVGDTALAFFEKNLAFINEFSKKEVPFSLGLLIFKFFGVSK